MLTIIGIALIGVGTMTTYALCKAAGVQSRLEEQDEVSILQQELYRIIDTKGLDSPEVLILSQELDIAIIKKQRERIAREKG